MVAISHISLAGQYGGGALAIDASDNLYILYYQANPKPEYYGGQGETQITKLNSSGVEQWTRVTGGQTPFMGQNMESAYDIHSTSGGQLYIVGASNGYNGQFHGDSISTGTGFLFKADGTHSYIGQDSFTITATGTQPTSTVTLTLTSSDTSEMIPQPDQGTKTIPANSNWNNPITIYVAAVQDNTTDSNSTPNLVITTSSSDASWNGLTFNVPVTVVNQTQPTVAGIDWWCCGNQSPSSPAIGSPNPVVDFPYSRAKAVSIPEGVNVLFNTKLDNEPIGGTVVYDIAASSSRISSNLSQLIFTESADLTTRWDNYAPSNRQWRITINDDSIDQSDVNDEVYLTLTINGATTDSRYNALSPIQVWFDPVDDDVTLANPTITSVTDGVQQNTIAWNAYSGATGYKLYWDTSASVSTSDNLITISDNTSTSYIHSGRTAGTQYYYQTDCDNCWWRFRTFK